METNKKRSSFFSLLMGRMFGVGSRSILEEEQIQSPTKTIIKKFFSNKLSMLALSVFLGILLFVTIAPSFFKLDLRKLRSKISVRVVILWTYHLSFREIYNP